MGSRPVSKDAADRWAEVEEHEGALLARLAGGDEDARQGLVLGRLPYVRSRGRAFASGLFREHLDDLIGEGTLVLITEIAAMDAARYGSDPVGFSIHIGHRVKQAFADYVREFIRTGSVAPTRQTWINVSRCIEARDRLYRELGREPTAKEVKDAAQVRVSVKTVASYISWQATGVDDDAGPEDDAAVDRTTPAVLHEAAVSSEAVTAVASTVIKLCDPAEHAAVVRFFGLDGRDAEKTPAIAKAEGLATDTVSKVRHKAIKRARRMLRVAAV